MARALRPCAACRRHVAFAEVRCPFCEAALDPAIEPRARNHPGHPAVRLSRAARLALKVTLGGVAATACAAPPGGAAAPDARSTPPPTPSPTSAPSASASPPVSSSSDAPAEPPRRVVAIYGSNEIVILDHVDFDAGSSKVPASADGLLGALAETTRAYPTMHVGVTGTANPREAAAPLLESLAKRRAASVVDALVARGVPRERLHADVKLEPGLPWGTMPAAELAQHRSVRFRPLGADGSPFVAP